MTMDDHSSLVQWMCSNRGYLHPDIELAYDVKKGYFARVLADKTVKAGSCVARCSMTTSLSVLNAFHTPPFSCRGTWFPSTFLRNQTISVVQCFFLMEQWILQARSWWAPYLSTLPKPDEIETLYFTDTKEDLRWLGGTNLETAIRRQTEAWHAQFVKGMDQLRKLEWPNAVNGRYSWDLFRWASTVFGSRSFTSQVLSNTLPADKARPMGHLDPDHEVLSSLFEDGFAVLLPLLDLLNYRPLSRVEWQAGLNEVGLQVLESFQGGQEVCNNYGPRDNEALMLGYGFSIAANPFDHFAVGLKVPVGSPLAEARAWRADQSLKTNKKSKADEDYRYYIFNAEHPRAQGASLLEISIFSQDLVDSISVLSANCRELRSDRFRLTGTVLDIKGRGLTDRSHFRNLLHTLCQLNLECSSRLKRIRADAPGLKDGAAVVISQKEQYAGLYRASQLQILETAILLSRYCLLKAQSSRGKNCDLLSSAVAAEQILGTSAAIADVENLIHRTPSTIDTRLLFDFSDAVKLLPPELAAESCDTTELFLKALRGDRQCGFSQPLAMADDICEKIGFAVLLAALRRAYSENTEALSTSTALWIKHLRLWYPFDDPFWNDPTEDFLPTLEALVGVADQVGFKTKESAMEAVWSAPRVLLSWGWNVQEEEGVFFDHETLGSNGDSAASRPSKYLLCIPFELESNGVLN